MRKSFLVTVIVCASMLAASAAQQQNPAAAPAQSPAATPPTPAVPVAPVSTCPAVPQAPTVTSPVAVGTTDIKGTAAAPVAGCASEIQVRLTPAGTILPLAPGTNPTVSSDGTFSLKLQTGLTAGQTINVTQAFVSMNGTAAPHPEVASATVAIPAAPAAAAPVAPTPTAAQQKPAIAGALREGSNAISGTIGKLPANAGGATCSAQVEVHDTSGTGQLLQMSGGAARGAVGTNNTYSLTLQEFFRGGQKIRVDEIFQNCAGPATLSSDEVDVVVPGDWGRVKGYFTTGILLSQNQNSFSQSSLFMGFNLDKTWRMPGYYHQKSGKATAEKNLKEAQNALAVTNSLPGTDKEKADKVHNATRDVQKARNNLDEATAKNKFQMSRWPGINTFFDVRLTSIPVSACNLPNGASGSNSGSCASPSPTPTPAAGTVHQQAAAATPSPTPLDTFLSQRKTARLTVGTYFPFTITSWTYNKTPNALFIAPLAKVGFDTPAGDLTQIQSSINTTTGTTTNTSATTVTAVNQTSFYNFYGYGGRIGHYALTSSRNEAPELVSYLDIIVGRFSNLESLIIPETGATPDHPAKRIRLYRLALEGVLKVPSTPMIIGFSANVGQESLGLGPNTIVQRAGDDLRFLFGVRFDAAKLMSVIAKAAP